MAYEPRPIYAYELHGHDVEGPLDYQRFFEGIASLHPLERHHQVAAQNEVVAIPEIRRAGEDRYEIRFIVGREGDVALFYDLETGEEREAQPRDGEVPVQTSWLIIDAAERIAIQERRRPGVPLNYALSCLVNVAREHQIAENPTLTLHPFVSDSFIEEVDTLERIKSASIVLNRPNSSWLDAADSLLSEAAAESNAGVVELGARARPKESLAKNDGIVAEIKDMVRADFSALKSASVEGRKPGELRDHRVSTRKHAMRKEVHVPRSATRREENEVLLSGAGEYIDELQQRREARARRSADPGDNNEGNDER